MGRRRGSRGLKRQISWGIRGQDAWYAQWCGKGNSYPLYQDEWGAWEAAIRWSTVDLTDGSVNGGEMDVLSFGLTWWLTPSFNMSANYRSISLDRFDLVGRSDGFNLRVVLMLD